MNEQKVLFDLAVCHGVLALIRRTQDGRLEWRLRDSAVYEAEVNSETRQAWALTLKGPAHSPSLIVRSLASPLHAQVHWVVSRVDGPYLIELFEAVEQQLKVHETAKAFLVSLGVKVE